MAANSETESVAGSIMDCEPEWTYFGEEGSCIGNVVNNNGMAATER